MKKSRRKFSGARHSAKKIRAAALRSSKSRYVNVKVSVDRDVKFRGAGYVSRACTSIGGAKTFMVSCGEWSRASTPSKAVAKALSSLGTKFKKK